MGLYYQAILSSLLLNFLPDLPRTFFFTPQYPILVFFHFGFYFFSFFLPHYCRFSTSKKKKKFSFAFVWAMYFFLFFPHKSPHFLWGLSSRTDRSLPQFQRWWPQPWWLNDLRKVATLYLYCGSSDSCSNSRYGAWHAHAHGRHPHPTSPKITTNTPIHPFILQPSACHLLCLPRVCVCVFLWHVGQSAVQLFDPWPRTHMNHVSKNKGWSRMIGLVQWHLNQSWSQISYSVNVSMGSGGECAWACWASVICSALHDPIGPLHTTS